MFYLKFDTKKDRILPPLLAMFDEISHVNRFIGNGRHGVSFFGCYITSRSSEVAAVSQSIKRKDKANKEKGDKTKDNYVRGDISSCAILRDGSRPPRDRINIDAHIKSIRHPLQVLYKRVFNHQREYTTLSNQSSKWPAPLRIYSISLGGMGFESFGIYYKNSPRIIGDGLVVGFPGSDSIYRAPLFLAEFQAKVSVIKAPVKR